MEIMANTFLEKKKTPSGVLHLEKSTRSTPECQEKLTKIFKTISGVIFVSDFHMLYYSLDYAKENEPDF